MMTGAMRSKPVSALETTTGCSLLKTEAVSKCYPRQQHSKDTDHPMHSRGSKPTFKRHRPPHAQPGEQANIQKTQATPCTAGGASQQKEGRRGPALSIIAGSLRDNSLKCWITCQNPPRPMQLSPAGKDTSSQPSSLP